MNITCIIFSVGLHKTVQLNTSLSTHPTGPLQQSTGPLQQPTGPLQQPTGPLQQSAANTPPFLYLSMSSEGKSHYNN